MYKREIIMTRTYNQQATVSKYRCVIVKVRENVNLYFMVKEVHLETFSKFLMENFTTSVSDLLDALMASKLNRIFYFVSPKVIDLRHNINLQGEK